MTRQEAWQIYCDTHAEIAAWPILSRYIDLIGSGAYADDAKDVDIMILVYDRDPYLEQCMAKGFIGLPNPDYPDEWVSLKRGPVNLLITADDKYFLESQKAAWVCQGLQLKTRKERVIVHRIIVDTYSAQGAIESVDGMDD